MYALSRAALQDYFFLKDTIPRTAYVPRICRNQLQLQSNPETRRPDLADVLVLTFHSHDSSTQFLFVEVLGSVLLPMSFSFSRFPGRVLARFFLARFFVFGFQKRCEGAYCVDLGERFPTHIWLQSSASIQRRTSPVKFARSKYQNPPVF